MKHLKAVVYLFVMMALLFSVVPVKAAGTPSWYGSVKLSYPNSVRAGQAVNVKWGVPSALRYDNTEVYVDLCNAAGCRKAGTADHFSIAKITVKIPRNFVGPGEFYLNYEHLQSGPYSTAYSTKGHSFAVLPAMPILTPGHVNNVFKSVYGREPSAVERKYWVSRLKDKNTEDVLRGAMMFQKSKIKPKVLGVKTNDAFRLEITDERNEAVPGEVVTVKMAIKNVLHGDQIDITTDASAEARNLEVSKISDGGKLRKYTGESKGGAIDWSAQKFYYNKSKTLTFNVKVPEKSFGNEFCTTGTVYATHGYSLVVLTGEDCTKIGKSKTGVILKNDEIKPSDVGTIFKQVYGRKPDTKELAYWKKRAIEKGTKTAVRGAMTYNKGRNSTGVGPFKNK